MIATYHPTPDAQGAFREISHPPSMHFGVTGRRHIMGALDVRFTAIIRPVPALA
jgi:hypothetical protein